jgi:Uma2 family endonuclease
MVAQPQLMTPQTYLEWEEQQPLKYEYTGGEVFAMTGGTIPHNDIALNLASALKSDLRGKGCKVQMADVKVGISQNGPFYYPDVIVSCDARDQTAQRILYHPCLIVEVLSPSTEAVDRGKKFRHYRQIKTLREYVLIDADRMNVECYRLNEKGKWELTTYATGDLLDKSPEESPEELLEEFPETLKVHLISVNFCCPIELLYEDVVFPQEPPAEDGSLGAVIY